MSCHFGLCFSTVSMKHSQGSCVLWILLSSIMTPKIEGVPTGSYRFSVFFGRHAEHVRVNESDVISWSTARSTSKCSSRCLKDIRCVSFLFDRNTSKCIVLRKLLPAVTSLTDPIYFHGKYYVLGEDSALKSTKISLNGNYQDYCKIFIE